MIQDTSKQCYKDLLDSDVLSHLQREVFEYILDNPGLTDGEISHGLGFDDNNQERPRRFELVDLGWVVSGESRVCSVSGKTCLVWSASEFQVIKKGLECLSMVQVEKVKKLLRLANGFQRNKFSGFLKELEGESGL